MSQPRWIWVFLAGCVTCVTSAATANTIGPTLAVGFGAGAAGYLASRLRYLDSPHDRPWRKVLLVIVVAFSAVLVRIGHGVLIGEEFPIPSPVADAMIVFVYFLIISFEMDLVRLRTAGRDIDAWLDATVAAGAVGVLMWITIMDSYVFDETVALSERATNTMYFVLSILLLTTTMRVMAAPGLRGPVYYLLGGAGAVIFGVDLFGTLAFAKGWDATALISGMPLAAGLTTAALLHPDRPDLTARPDDVEPSFRLWRAAVLSTGIALPWAIIANGLSSFGRGQVAVLVATGPAFVTLILFRMIRLVRAREALLEQADRLREAGDDLLSRVVDPSEIYEVTATAIGVVTVTKTDWEAVVIGGKVVAGNAPENVCQYLTTCTEDEVRMPVDAGSNRNHFFAVAIPRTGSESGWIVASSESQLLRHDRQALRALAREASMALRGADRAAAVAEAEAERRFTRAIVESERRQRALLLHSSDIVAVIAGDWTITYISPPVRTVLGYDPDELLGTSIRQLFAPESEPVIHDLVTQATTFGSSSGEISLVHRSGQARTLQVVLGDHRGEDDVDGIIVNARDISTTRALEERLERDPVTGAFNREAFTQRTDRQLQHQPSTTGLHALVAIEISDLELVTSAGGFKSSDTLLVEVADRLRSNVRVGDGVARLDGSTFAVLLDRILSEAELVEVTNRIVFDVTRPISIADGQVDLVVQAGAVLCDPGNRATDLLANALTAKSTAAESGEVVGIYEEGSEQGYQLQLELRSRMRTALAEGEFSLHYQPIVNIREQRVIGAEALARWTHPLRGPVGPNIFIAEAERGGLIVEFGEWVIRTAAHQLRQWKDSSLVDDGFTLAVNVSALQLRPGITETFRSALDAEGIQPSQIRIELTESLFASSDDAATAIVRDLAEAGHSIAIDDFGTGTSNLARLGRYPIDVVKLDRTLVAPLEGREGRAIDLVERTLGLIYGIEAEAIAEGIESPTQALVLRELGCRMAQGFFFGRPCPAEEFVEEFLRRELEGEALAGHAY